MFHILRHLTKWADVNKNLLKQPQQDTKLENQAKGTNNDVLCPHPFPIMTYPISSPYFY